LISATFGKDHVWPICEKPVSQPVSLVRFGQPRRHLSTGAVGVVTSKAYSIRPPRRIVGKIQTTLLSAFWNTPAEPSKK